MADTLTKRQALATHETYQVWESVWAKLAHVREGSGGFLDGTYLIAHPREWKDYTADEPRVPTKKLKARRAIACYENFAATIIEAKKAALFRESPLRRVGKHRDHPLGAWWENVDGAGTHVDDFMALAWDVAATFGHVYLYLDRPAGTPTTAADERAPFLRPYTPLDAYDWIEDDRGELQSVKFVEAAPRDTLAQSVRQGDLRVRVVDRETWTLYGASGKRLDGGEHKLGMLPVLVLYAQRRPLMAHVGQSVLGDPQLYLDLYNLTSEVRELLRNQTFGVLNVPLGTGEQALDIERARTMLGESTGTDNVLFSGLAASFISPDARNVEVYHAEIARRLRTIYRLASIPWEADSRDAEAEGSLKLKREDMNQRLSAYADELERVEYAIVKLWYRAMFGADLGATKYAQEAVEIRYPDEFDVTPLNAVIEQGNALMGLGMPADVLREARKRIVPRVLPDLPPDIAERLAKAIDAQDEPATSGPEQRLRSLERAMRDTQAVA